MVQAARNSAVPRRVVCRLISLVCELRRLVKKHQRRAEKRLLTWEIVADHSP